MSVQGSLSKMYFLNLADLVKHSMPPKFLFIGIFSQLCFFSHLNLKRIEQKKKYNMEQREKGQRTAHSSAFYMGDNEFIL